MLDRFIFYGLCCPPGSHFLEGLMRASAFKAAACLAALLVVVFCSESHATVISSDDAESYSSWSYGNNGGTGFGPITYLEGTGGGIFLSTDGAHVDRAKSFAMLSDGGVP